jgi:hypothetical protein
MKPQDIHKGMKVVATDLPDATVYTVETINKFVVELRYTTPSGRVVNAGVLDACFLNIPTNEQLANA